MLNGPITERDQLGRCRRIVIKIGTRLITDDATGLNTRFLDSVGQQMAELREQGHEFIVVTSGAIFLGRRLLALRRDIPHVVSKRNLTVQCRPGQNVMTWHRRHEWGEVAGLMNFAPEAREVLLPVSQRTWAKVLDSADSRWDGPGAMPVETIAGRRRVTMPPQSVAVFRAGSALVAEEQRAAEAAVSVGQE